MYIVHLTSELAPVAKVGGLGDVVYSLSHEAKKLGHEVEVILPKYDTFDYTKVKNLKVHFRELWSYDGHDKFNNTVWSCEVNGVKALLIEPHHPRYFFSRGMIYGCADDIDRFLYFTRAAIEFLFKSGRKPDCVHLHDWPVAVGATLIKDMYRALGFSCGGTLLTIHNMEHQGKCNANNLIKIGLSGFNYLRPDKYQDPFYSDVINLLKGGIEDSTAITTVSPTYAKEIMTQEGGHGLDLSIKRNVKKLHGILNGIDTEYWNPKEDNYLIHKFPYESAKSADKLDKILKAKAENKRLVKERFGLTGASGPLVGCVTRLVAQKGLDLIKAAMHETMKEDGLFILLGSEHSHQTKQDILEIQRQYAADKRMAVHLERDEELAHLLFAASDIIIVPSLFEPCGLTQMIALRYGAIPLVRKTGGLADTVFDIDNSAQEHNLRNGYVFNDAKRSDIEKTLRRAFALYKQDKGSWNSLIANALSFDYSWNTSIQKYITLYRM